MIHPILTPHQSHSSFFSLQVLEALEEIAFRPEFLSTRIEKERKAVMAEAQVMIGLGFWVLGFRVWGAVCLGLREDAGVLGFFRPNRSQHGSHACDTAACC